MHESKPGRQVGEILLENQESQHSSTQSASYCNSWLKIGEILHTRRTCGLQIFEVLWNRPLWHFPTKLTYT